MTLSQNLESKRLLLINLGLDHLSNDYVSWMNDPLVYKYLESNGDYTLAILKNYLLDVEKRNMYFWAIHLKSNKKHIGNIKIDPINLKHGVGEFGIMMGDRKEWGKGYAKEASQLIIDFCFTEIKLRKISLGVVEDNIAAFQLYKNLGFEIEGVFKKHGFYNGKLSNITRMAIFNESHD